MDFEHAGGAGAGLAIGEHGGAGEAEAAARAGDVGAEFQPLADAGAAQEVQVQIYGHQALERRQGAVLQMRQAAQAHGVVAQGG